jgi:hypothetical protein
MFEVVNQVGYKRAFKVTTDLNSISGTSEHPYLLLKNPAGSQPLLITHFLVGTNSASVRTITRFYANPTVTADGTGLTETNTYITASPPAALASAFMNPTISANGGILNTTISPANTPSRGINRYYWLDGGNNLLVTIENSVSNASTFADIYWIEGA